MQFYFCNIIQLPVFIIMVLSIRKISFENEELTGAGMLWFPNLNEADPYLVLPITAALLNYFNLSVSTHFSSNFLFLARYHERKWALVHQQIPYLLQCALVFPSTFHPHLACWCLPVLDQQQWLHGGSVHPDAQALVPKQSKPQLLLRLCKDVWREVSQGPR